MQAKFLHLFKAQRVLQPVLYRWWFQSERQIRVMLLGLFDFSVSIFNNFNNFNMNMIFERISNYKYTKMFRHIQEYNIKIFTDFS